MTVVNVRGKRSGCLHGSHNVGKIHFTGKTTKGNVAVKGQNTLMIIVPKQIIKNTNVSEILVFQVAAVKFFRNFPSF